MNLYKNLTHYPLYFTEIISNKRYSRYPIEDYKVILSDSEERKVFHGYEIWKTSTWNIAPQTWQYKFLAERQRHFSFHSHKDNKFDFIEPGQIYQDKKLVIDGHKIVIDDGLKFYIIQHYNIESKKKNVTILFETKFNELNLALK